MILVALLLALQPTATLPAATLRAATLPTTGTHSYTLVSDSSDDVKAAVNYTVEHMSFFTRPTARKRLMRLNPIPERVQVAVTSDSLSVEFENLNPIVTPLDGTEVSWHSEISNDTYAIHVVQQGDTLAQVFTAKDGERTNTYLFDDESARLAVHVMITSHRLPRPLEYTLVYRRDD